MLSYYQITTKKIALAMLVATFAFYFCTFQCGTSFVDLLCFFCLVSTGVIPILLFLLATRTVLRKAAIDRGVRLATGQYGCRYRGVTS